jgi:hypothetical protein
MLILALEKLGVHIIFARIVACYNLCHYTMGQFSFKNLYRQTDTYSDTFTDKYSPLPPPTCFNVASMPEDVSFVIWQQH